MKFKVFAKKLKNVIGGKSNTKIFTKTIFKAMMNESGPELLEGTSPDTFKTYFNGNTKAIDESDIRFIDLQLLECSEEEDKSVVRFCVHKLKSADKDGDDKSSYTVVPFQIAYAVSIHKAQGLEYDSVKIVITDEVEKLVTHNIFNTAITKAREKLKIYWTLEVEEKVINRI